MCQHTSWANQMVQHMLRCRQIWISTATLVRTEQLCSAKGTLAACRSLQKGSSLGAAAAEKLRGPCRAPGFPFLWELLNEWRTAELKSCFVGRMPCPLHVELALEIACFPGFSSLIKFCSLVIDCYVWKLIKYISFHPLQLIFLTKFNNLRINSPLFSLYILIKMLSNVSLLSCPWVMLN